MSIKVLHQHDEVIWYELPSAVVIYYPVWFCLLCSCPGEDVDSGFSCANDGSCMIELRFGPVGNWLVVVSGNLLSVLCSLKAYDHEILR